MARVGKRRLNGKTMTDLQAELIEDLERMHSALAGLKEGDTVRVRGTTAGFDDYGRPIVELLIRDPAEYPTGGGLAAFVMDRDDVE